MNPQYYWFIRLETIGGVELTGDVMLEAAKYVDKPKGILVKFNENKNPGDLKAKVKRTEVAYLKLLDSFGTLVEEWEIILDRPYIAQNDPWVFCLEYSHITFIDGSDDSQHEARQHKNIWLEL
mgnify:CR=1 FL=1